jgi:hypothetical protein
MNKNNKKQTLTKIYKTMDKALDKLIANNAKKYLKSFKNKPWHTIALEGYKNTSKGLMGMLNGHTKVYVKAIESKELFNKKKVIKDDDIEDEEYGDIDEVLDDILEYEDVVDKDIQNILEKIKEKIIEELEEFFEEDIEKDLILVAAEEIAKDLGIKFNFNKFDVFTRDYLKDKKIKWARQVAETTEKRVKELLIKGFEEGLGSYDIADLIYQDGIFGYTRAEMIARTEIIGSCNYADYTMWHFDENIYAKKWSATGGPRTRDDHNTANGQVRKLDEPFIVGGEKLMYPLDGSLGASAKNIVQCRCTMFYLTKDEYEKEKGI